MWLRRITTRHRTRRRGSKINRLMESTLNEHLFLLWPRPASAHKRWILGWAREISRILQILYLSETNWWRICQEKSKTISSWSKEINSSMRKATMRWYLESRRQDWPFHKSFNFKRWPICLVFQWIQQLWASKLKLNQIERLMRMWYKTVAGPSTKACQSQVIISPSSTKVVNRASKVWMSYYSKSRWPQSTSNRDSLTLIKPWSMRSCSNNSSITWLTSLPI